MFTWTMKKARVSFKNTAVVASPSPSSSPPLTKREHLAQSLPFSMDLIDLCLEYALDPQSTFMADTKRNIHKMDICPDCGTIWCTYLWQMDLYDASLQHIRTRPFQNTKLNPEAPAITMGPSHEVYIGNVDGTIQIATCQGQDARLLHINLPEPTLHYAKQANSLAVDTKHRRLYVGIHRNEPHVAISHRGLLAAIDLDTGNRLWCRDDGESFDGYHMHLDARFQLWTFDSCSSRLVLLDMEGNTRHVIDIVKHWSADLIKESPHLPSQPPMVSGLTFDAKGRLWITDRFHKLLWLLNAQGECLWTWRDSAFSYPDNCVFSPRLDRLYVEDEHKLIGYQM